MFACVTIFLSAAYSLFCVFSFVCLFVFLPLPPFGKEIGDGNSDRPSATQKGGVLFLMHCNVLYFYLGFVVFHVVCCTREMHSFGRLGVSEHCATLANVGVHRWVCVCVCVCVQPEGSLCGLRTESRGARLRHARVIFCCCFFFLFLCVAVFNKLSAHPTPLACANGACTCKIGGYFRTTPLR